MSKQINPLIRAPDIHEGGGIDGGGKAGETVILLYKSEVRHGTIMNSMVRLLHVSQVEPSPLSRQAHMRMVEAILLGKLTNSIFVFISIITYS